MQGNAIRIFPDPRLVDLHWSPRYNPARWSIARADDSCRHRNDPVVRGSFRVGRIGSSGLGAPGPQSKAARWAMDATTRILTLPSYDRGLRFSLFSWILTLKLLLSLC